MNELINRLAMQGSIFKVAAIAIICVALLMSHWLDTDILILPIVLSGWLDTKYLEIERRIRNAENSEQET